MNWLEEPAAVSGGSCSVLSGARLSVPRDSGVWPGSEARRPASAAKLKRRFCSVLPVEANESRCRGCLERPEVFSRALAGSSIYLRHR